MNFILIFGGREYSADKVTGGYNKKSMFTKKDTDFCKGIAIVLMIFHHLFNDYEEYEGIIVNYSPFSGDYLMHLAMLARVCVAIFVFLSGYGIASTYRKKFGQRIPDKKEIGVFVWNRYWKLMAGYWFAFLLTLLCQPLGRTVFEAYGTELKSFAMYFLVDVLGLAYLFSTPTLNPTWWYMTLAIAIIVLMPFIMQLMQRFGAFLVTIGTVFMILMFHQLNPLTVYFFPVMLGAACRECDVFERVNALWKEKRGGFALKILLECIVFVLLLKYKSDYNYGGMLEGLLALDIALLVNGCLIKLPVISDVMEYLGKHSANMFLVHNQIYSYYFLGFFYSMKHWIIITVAVTAASFAASVLMEKLKKITGYQKITERLGEYFMRTFLSI